MTLRRLTLPLLLALACALPWLVAGNGYLIRVLTLLLMFAAMAQAWNIVGGLANQISLGHAAFFGIGAYTSTILLVRIGLSPWLGVLAGAAMAAAAGALLSLPTMRLKVYYFALATLAFGEVLRAVGNTWASMTGGPGGISVPLVPGGGLSAMQFASGRPSYYLMLAALLIVTAVYWQISSSRLGYELRAVKANVDSAEVIGISTARTKIVAATLSAGLMGGCGVLYAQFNFVFDPDSIFSLVGLSVRVALICIIGGIGRLWGPIIGACFLLPLEELFNATLSGKGAGFDPGPRRERADARTARPDPALRRPARRQPGEFRRAARRTAGPDRPQRRGQDHAVQSADGPAAAECRRGGLRRPAHQRPQARRLRRDEGLTFIVIEHPMRAIMNLCERIVVLNFGHQIAAGAPQQISRDPDVIAAYLGQEMAA